MGLKRYKVSGHIDVRSRENARCSQGTGDLWPIRTWRLIPLSHQGRPVKGRSIESSSSCQCSPAPFHAAGRSSAPAVSIPKGYRGPGMSHRDKGAGRKGGGIAQRQIDTPPGGNTCDTLRVCCLTSQKCPFMQLSRNSKYQAAARGDGEEHRHPTAEDRQHGGQRHTLRRSAGRATAAGSCARAGGRNAANADACRCACTTTSVFRRVHYVVGFTDPRGKKRRMQSSRQRRLFRSRRSSWPSRLAGRSWAIQHRL